MSYLELLDECERDGIGPRFWTLLLEVAGRVARRYPPTIYNEAEQWSDEAVRDLAQDVALERLIGENQLEYVLNLATDEDSLSRLLAFQVRRVLSHRRAITVVDRLVTRIRQIVGAPDFQSIELGEDSFIAFANGGREPRNLTAAQLRRGSLVIDSIPRLVSSPTAERESKVYSGESLDELLRLLVDAFEGISIRDVRRILEITLTAWLPTILRDYEDDHVDETDPELEVERSEMSDLIENFAAGVGQPHRVVLLGKANGLSDGELAQRLDRSRPWIADRKQEVLEMVETTVISRVPSELHGEAARLLLEELAELESQND